MSERDACGIVAVIEKDASPRHRNVLRAIEALYRMAHRAGAILGEGDGTGVMTDIPRELWAERLERAGLEPTLAQNPRFFVGHLFIPKAEEERIPEVLDLFRVQGAKRGVRLLYERRGETNPRVLGPVGRRTEPVFLQLAGLSDGGDGALFELALELERSLPVHVVSLSTHVVVYKVRGSAEILKRYYPELAYPNFRSRITLGHNRYSTNTLSTFEQVQPFGLLAHNGEINTIERLRRELLAYGVPLSGGSDSQDLNRMLATLIFRFQRSLPEAIDLVFPPILGEIHAYSPVLQDLYVGFRERFGPLAQGPAALVTRYASEAVFATDAMGLRPLWFVETPYEYVFSSERGVFSAEEFVREPRPLAPGERVSVRIEPEGVRLFPFDRHQRLVLERTIRKNALAEGVRVRLAGPPPAAEAEVVPIRVFEGQKRAFGWDRWDERYLKALAQTGREPVGSLGWDAPLAALAPEPPNLAEFFKETVAVVTNPALDREREVEHFSTRALLGRRALPDARGGGEVVELVLPLLLEPSFPEAAEIARSFGTLTTEALLARLPHAVLVPYLAEDETLEEALQRLGDEAVRRVEEGAALLVLDDREAFEQGAWLDVHLALAEVERRLAEARDASGVALRRRTSILVRSGGLRNLHDLMLAFGLGADAAAPWLMQAEAYRLSGAPGVQNLLSALKKGIEKVMSTMGIHELRGYGRVFSAIGLAPELAQRFGVRTFFASKGRGYGVEELERTLRQRRALWQKERPKPPPEYRETPRLYKAAQRVARGEAPFSEYEAHVLALEEKQPVAARHLLRVRFPEEGGVRPEEVSIAAGEHALPFVISAMSFGSQGETAFRAYVEAAKRLDMLAMNGEGGEIPDLLGKYNRWRGQQVASGRFGVHALMLNSAAVIEIKIGQGAKPGEGGHLPGRKVTAKVAAARNAVPGVDLISPSNNHDLYSIEDLAQLVEELKTVNPEARVSVKVPVIPGIGTIAVGIAKAGADIINLSGFEGGTGAAREHALKYAGLPVELGVRRAHRALVRAGLRDRVEIWADGGLRTAMDALRMALLGANRVGFGTLAMIAIGCTACRGCQFNTCHVGIATQIESEEEARSLGLKRFVPRDFDQAVAALVRFFGAMGEALKAHVARLGAKSLSELVGRSDLLEQAGFERALDLGYLFEPVSAPEWRRDPGARVLRRPTNELTRSITRVVMAAYERGERELVFQEGPVGSADRALGTHLAGELARRRLKGEPFEAEVELRFDAGSVAGNGLGAFNLDPIRIVVEGGAQDGVGKSAYGGEIFVLKGKNPYGVYVDGSVGKSFAYGAIRGLFIVEGNADSRCCVRLSGADVVLAGEPERPLQDELGNLGARANLKGFAFEYMTRGRAVVLGDPGPWMASGMTGGRVYLRLWPEMGLDEAAYKRRLAKGAKVELLPLDEQGRSDVQELLGRYEALLREAERQRRADQIALLAARPEHHFLMLVPRRAQEDQEVSTE